MKAWDLVYLLGLSRTWDDRTPGEVVALLDAARSGAGPLTIHNGRAVDLGCGTGANAIFLARRGFVVTGLDISARALGRAREKARGAGVAVDFREADLLGSDVAAPAPFDLGLDVGTLHLFDAAQALRYGANLARLIRQGGEVCIFGVTPGARSAGIALRRALGAGVRGLTPQSVGAALEPHGFTLIASGESSVVNGTAMTGWYVARKA